MNWKRILVEDWPRKLVAVLLALIIWYAVSAQLQQRMTITVPVQFTTDDTSVKLTDPENLPQVTITLRGSNRSLSQVTSNNVEVLHQIQRWPGAGDYEAFIREQNVDLPHGVHIMDITPNRVNVSLDKVTTKELTVVPTFAGRLESGWERRRTEIVPRTVKVRGLRRELDDLREITTQPIPLGDDTPVSFDIEVALKPPTDRIEVIGRNKVVVTVELRRTLVEEPMSGLNLHVLQLKESQLYVAEIELPRYQEPGVKVVIEGPSEAIDRLTSDAVRAFIDITAVPQAGKLTLPVQIWLNARGCRVREQSIQPMNVEVTIARRPDPADASPPSAPEPTVPEPGGQ